MDAKMVGHRIQQARNAAGITQKQLAEQLDLSTKYISNIECGVKVPKLDTFIKIANALNIDTNSLLKDVLECKADITASKLNELINPLSDNDQETMIRIAEMLLNKNK